MTVTSEARTHRLTTAAPAAAQLLLDGLCSDERRNQADELLNHLQLPGTLLVLDGFERVLRAYANMLAAYQDDAEAAAQGTDTDCVSPVAEHFLRSLCTLPGIQGKALYPEYLTDLKCWSAPRTVPPMPKRFEVNVL